MPLCCLKEEEEEEDNQKAGYELQKSQRNIMVFITEDEIFPLVDTLNPKEDAC